MRYTSIFFLFFSIIFWGCSDSGKVSSGLLPKATGSAGEMIVVIDSTQWSGNLGQEIRKTLSAEVQGLPRTEPMFKLNRVNPQKMNNVLRAVKNLLFVVTLDSNTPDSKVIRNYFTKSSIQQIKEDSNIFVFTDNDVYSRGQKVMYLFSQSEEQLIQKLQENQSQLQSYFNKAENERLHDGLFKAKELKAVSDLLVKEHNCFMRIPFGYKVIVNEKGFIWFRQINDENDKDIFISYKPYISEKAFENERIIQNRDSIAMSQLFEDPEYPDTHIVTETEVPYIPVTSRQVNFNGNFAMETRGLWKTNNLSMGGPFLGYTIVDEELGRLYYIEGFLYSPGQNQREFMRELEVILSTFRTKANIPELASN